MSEPYPEIEDRRHAECLAACFESCNHMTIDEIRGGVVSVQYLRELFLFEFGRASSSQRIMIRFLYQQITKETLIGEAS